MRNGLIVVALPFVLYSSCVLLAAAGVRTLGVADGSVNRPLAPGNTPK